MPLVIRENSYRKAQVLMDYRRNTTLEEQLVQRINVKPSPTIYAYQFVGSTMEVAHELAREGAAEGTLVWAQRQTKGRGRLGRTWESPEGGVYFSLILRPTRPLVEVPQLSLVAGLSTAQTIWQLAVGGPSPAASGTSFGDPASRGARLGREHRSSGNLAGVTRSGAPDAARTVLRDSRKKEHGGGVRSGRTRARYQMLSMRCEPGPAASLFPSIRWPNDVLIHEKKVCGILVEAKDGAVIVGIGINVTTRKEDLPETATSLRAAGVDGDPYELTGALYQQFRTWYDVWTKDGFAPIREALRPWIGLFGHPVHITAGSERFEGTATDLDESGRLLVRLDSGILRPFEVGQVTLLR